MKHLEKFLLYLEGIYTYVNTSPAKEEASYTYSLRVGVILRRSRCKNRSPPIYFMVYICLSSWSCVSHTMGKVQGWRTFPKCTAGLSSHLILFWECNPHHPLWGFALHDQEHGRIRSYLCCDSPGLSEGNFLFMELPIRERREPGAHYSHQGLCPWWPRLPGKQLPGSCLAGSPTKYAFYST
jgi:hypothetical protein